jgi:competence ComEA-like helix-hairpin-helix protein
MALQEDSASAGLDLNRATQEELEAIDGIGGHAFEIIRYRDERGGFTAIDQLDEVPGFTGKLTDEIKGRLQIAHP